VPYRNQFEQFFLRLTCIPWQRMTLAETERNLDETLARAHYLVDFVQRLHDVRRSVLRPADDPNAAEQLRPAAGRTANVGTAALIVII
jgi:hypothetical protein